MLVLVDMEKQSVYIYTETGMKIFNVNNIDAIYNCIGNNYVYYVTSATEVSKNDIANMLSESTINNKEEELFLDNNPQSIQNIQCYGDDKYLKSNVKNTLVIPNEHANTIEDQEKPLMTFYNDHYCLPYDEEIVMKHNLVRNMIDKGVLSVINRQEYNYHMAECNKIMESKANNQKAMEDEKYGSIIVDGPVDDMIGGTSGWGVSDLNSLVTDGKSGGSDNETSQFTEVSDELNSLVRGLGIK